MLWEIMRVHPGKTLGVFGGLLLGILYIFFGFLDTIVVLVFISAGYYLGKKYDNRENLKDVLDRILPGKFTKS